MAKWFAAVAGVLVAIGVVAALVFDWNMLRGPLAYWISRETGREFAIDGDLRGEFSLTPWITAENVRLANPEWAREPAMLEVERLAFRIELPALLRGEIVLPTLRVSGARVDLEIDDEGRRSWELDGEPAADVTDLPVIEHLSIDASRLRLDDHTKRLELDASILSLVAVSPEEGVLPVRLEGSGRLGGEPFSLVARGGPLQDLTRDEEEPYPIQIHIDAADTSASLVGRLTQPEGLTGLDAELEIAGPNLARLAPVLGLPLPSTPSYEVTGRLRRDGDLWWLDGFSGLAGESDVAGSLSVDAGRERPLMTADIVSETLDLVDLGALIGLDPGVAQAFDEGAEGERERILPNAPLQLEQVRGTDARVAFRGERVLAPGLPLSDVELALNLENGVLQLAPFSFGLAGGELGLYASIYSTDRPVRTDYDIRLSNAHLERTLEALGLDGAGEGVLQGRVRFSTLGDTVRAAMATAEGDAAIAMDRGRVVGSALALIDVGFLEALALALVDGEPADMEIRCFLAAFDITDGVMTTNPMVLDTEDSLITGEGEIDLGEEVVDLRIAGEPKEFAIAASRFPIEVTGPLASPEVAVDPTEVIVRGGLAAALGALLGPLTAVLPLLEPGLAEDSPCRRLIAEAEDEVEEE